MLVVFFWKGACDGVFSRLFYYSERKKSNVITGVTFFGLFIF